MRACLASRASGSTGWQGWRGGRSALDIVHERLTREACRRLHYIAAPAETLARELGFDDPAYFNRFFKRRTGLTPHRWRETQRAAP